MAGHCSTHAASIRVTERNQFPPALACPGTIVLNGAVIKCTPTDREFDQQLVRSEAKYRGLLEAAPDAMVVVDEDGAIALLNVQAERQFGYSRDELIGRKVTDIIPIGFAERLVADKLRSPEEASAQQIGAGIELIALRKDGAEFPIEIMLSPLESADGILVTAAIRDISVRKAAEADLIVAKVDLGRKEAEAATAAKASFLANMSHEIRTPLNSIIGFSDLLLDDVSLNPVQRRYLDQIKNSGNALLTVVNDVLDFSKLDAGKVQLTDEPFSLDALVSSTISIVERSAEAKGLDLRVHTDPELTLYNRGDPARIRQILLNLLSNAVKFTAVGSVTLEISKISSAASKEHMRFAICDTGIGVPVNGQSGLFEQFAQADPSISRTYGGTGLGLSICKSLVELMGGRIGFANNEQAGATFWFEIELATATRTQVKPQQCADPDDRQGLRILLVEDLPMNQELACTILLRASHNVDIANDGVEALAALEQNSYDVILMDIQMPRMDGVTAARKIRQLDGPARHTPIIAMTANALPEQVREFRQAGMDDYVAKPFKQQDLHEALRRVVDMPATADPSSYEPAGDAHRSAPADGSSACRS